ncbi:MAG: hypothetical protein WAV20_15890, partial [Blastocatellia bacterium]
MEDALAAISCFNINTTYPNLAGQSPTGVVIFAGTRDDRSYSHGVELTELDIQGIVWDQIAAEVLPLDTSGIYLVIASSDV